MEYSEKIKSTKLVILEAKKFIKKAEESISALEKEIDQGGYKYQFKEVAAAKRASMDLSRALSEFRK
jgi:hypothetical protein